MERRFRIQLRRNGFGPLKRLHLSIRGRWLNLVLTRWKLRR